MNGDPENGDKSSPAAGDGEHWETFDVEGSAWDHWSTPEEAASDVRACRHGLCRAKLHPYGGFPDYHSVLCLINLKVK